MSILVNEIVNKIDREDQASDLEVVSVLIYMMFLPDHLGRSGRYAHG